MPTRLRTRSSAGARRGEEPRPSTLDRYLLESERLVFAVRRHSAVLAGATSVFLVLVLVAAVLLAFSGGSDVIATTGLIVLLAALAWYGWKVGDWWVEKFTVTDRRVLLVSGLLTRRVAIMPLRKVTDLTFERSITGRLLGYGAFVMESAGQQQALSRVDYLPRPEALYLQMSDLLFGSGGQDRDPDEDGPDLRRPRRPRRGGPPAGDRDPYSRPEVSTVGPRPRVTSRPPATSPAAPPRVVPPPTATTPTVRTSPPPAATTAPTEATVPPPGATAP
ncbi:PH domain-containing protein, partial [Jatrophihabitans sp. YIM 134969]